MVRFLFERMQSSKANMPQHRLVDFEQTTLEAKRLRLRWLREEDADDIFQIYSDEKAMRYWSTPPMQGLHEAKELLVKAQEDYKNGSALTFGLECKETLRILGTCSLFSFQHTSRRAEIGYILGHQYWGQGFMQEALKAVIDHAFSILELHRLEADIDPRNEASRKSLLRFGFSKEGLLRERWIVGGEVNDSELYGLLQSEWKER